MFSLLRKTYSLYSPLKFQMKESKISKYPMSYYEKQAHFLGLGSSVSSLANSNAKIATYFEGNKRRILESLKIAKAFNCTYRIGPELEIPGYSCEDHFYELDTVKHSWEVLAEILTTDYSSGMICDIGMPVVHRDVLYNARVIINDKKILYIRPKTVLSDDGNYRETRWFTTWKKKGLEEFSLPDFIKTMNGQSNPPIGVAIMQFDDAEVGHEICEELWQPGSPHIMMGLDGAEIIMNSSGSHFGLGRIKERLNLIKGATSKGGGAYVYSNLLGCDGSRLYFDGCSMVAANGRFLSIGKRFSFREVEVVTAVIDLDSVREEKIALKSRCGEAASGTFTYPRIPMNFRLCKSQERPTEPIDENRHISPNVASEIGKGPAIYMWDYLRRSGACGFFIALSGGTESAACALIVHSLCSQLYDHIVKKEPDHEFVLSELRRVIKDPSYTPTSVSELTGKFLFTCYMASQFSTEDSRRRAAQLAKDIGATHMEINIDKICDGFVESIHPIIKKTPVFQSKGGSSEEEKALQNLQARSRMVTSYLLTQLLPSEYKLPSFLLVLGVGNLDKSLRGYFTKYDCSSGDLNPIGGFSKLDLRSFLYDYHINTGIYSIYEIMNSIPSSELRPKEEFISDEVEMGLTYQEVSLLGILRKNYMFGPVAMFRKLVHLWPTLEPDQIAKKVKTFFSEYARNRHKMTITTPSIHGEKYSCDDNRYDLRPFLYNYNWDYQFGRIDELVAVIKKEKMEIGHAELQSVQLSIFEFDYT